MPYKCIYILTNEEFVIWSCIQAYKGNANVYEPLWTPTCICAVWTFFPYYFLSFLFLLFPKKTLSSPTLLTTAWQTPPIITASYITSPPYILLFSQHSPVIYKDFFPLFTCINRVDTTLYSTSIWVLCSPGQQFSKSWNWLHCSLQAFGYYCQQLPGLTTKSTHHYPYSYYFHTIFTFITQRILPLTLSFDIVPLDPLVPKLTMRLSADAQIPMIQRLVLINY